MRGVGWSQEVEVEKKMVKSVELTNFSGVSMLGLDGLIHVLSGENVLGAEKAETYTDSLFGTRVSEPDQEIGVKDGV